MSLSNSPRQEDVFSLHLISLLVVVYLILCSLPIPIDLVDLTLPILLSLPFLPTDTLPIKTLKDVRRRYKSYFIRVDYICAQAVPLLVSLVTSSIYVIFRSFSIVRSQYKTSKFISNLLATIVRLLCYSARVTFGILLTACRHILTWTIWTLTWSLIQVISTISLSDHKKEAPEYSFNVPPTPNYPKFTPLASRRYQCMNCLAVKQMTINPLSYKGGLNCYVCKTTMCRINITDPGNCVNKILFEKHKSGNVQHFMCEYCGTLHDKIFPRDCYGPCFCSLCDSELSRLPMQFWAINTQRREYKVEAEREDAKQRELYEREERWERIRKLCVIEMRNRRRLARQMKSSPVEKPRRWHESDPKADEHVFHEYSVPSQEIPEEVGDNTFTSVSSASEVHLDKNGVEDLPVVDILPPDLSSIIPNSSEGAVDQIPATSKREPFGYFSKAGSLSTPTPQNDHVAPPSIPETSCMDPAQVLARIGTLASVAVEQQALGYNSKNTSMFRPVASLPRMEERIPSFVNNTANSDAMPRSQVMSGSKGTIAGASFLGHPSLSPGSDTSHAAPAADPAKPLTARGIQRSKGTRVEGSFKPGSLTSMSREASRIRPAATAELNLFNRPPSASLFSRPQAFPVSVNPAPVTTFQESQLTPDITASLNSNPRISPTSNITSSWPTSASPIAASVSRGSSRASSVPLVPGPFDRCNTPGPQSNPMTLTNKLCNTDFLADDPILAEATRISQLQIENILKQAYHLMIPTTSRCPTFSFDACDATAGPRGTLSQLSADQVINGSVIRAGNTTVSNDRVINSPTPSHFARFSSVQKADGNQFAANNSIDFSTNRVPSRPILPLPRATFVPPSTAESGKMKNALDIIDRNLQITTGSIPSSSTTNQGLQRPLKPHSLKMEQNLRIRALESMRRAREIKATA